jgi:hypothetical protein
MTVKAKNPPAGGARRARECDRLGAYHGSEHKHPASDFQRVCCELNRSPALSHAAEGIHALGHRALRALLAEMIAGRNPVEAIRDYERLAETHMLRWAASLADRRRPQ